MLGIRSTAPRVWKAGKVGKLGKPRVKSSNRRSTFRCNDGNGFSYRATLRVRLMGKKVLRFMMHLQRMLGGAIV